MKGRVLVIAGSDCSGGAGIQADIKTVTALRGYAATAITALTVQDTGGVHEIMSVAPDFIVRQIEVVLNDIGADCIKIGMLHSPEAIEAVSEVLKRKAADIPLLLDPVMVAKGGAALLDRHGIEGLKRHLIPRSFLVTPNVPEAERLSDLPIQNLDHLSHAGKRIIALGANAVLLKGGHLVSDLVQDTLLTGEDVQVFRNPRIDSRHTHGTGCTLASAIATGIAQQMSLSDAVERAHGYVYQAIQLAPGFGAGHGPLNHTHALQ